MRRHRSFPQRPLGDVFRVLRILAVEHPTFIKAVDVLATRDLKRIERRQRRQRTIGGAR